MKASVERNSALVGNLACFSAYAIFGFNIICCKNIAVDGHITPMALFCLRSFGAALLFWLLSFVLSCRRRSISSSGSAVGSSGSTVVSVACASSSPVASLAGRAASGGDSHCASSARGETAELKKIEKGDYWKIALASFFGLFSTQLTFLLAIPHTTAIDASIMSSMLPIMTLLASAFVMRERITWSGVSGIALSVIGVMILIFNSVSLREGAATTSVGGIVGMIGNTLSFALYLSIFRPLIRKYSVVTFMKWMFLFSSLYALPFSFSAFSVSHLAAVPLSVALQVAYVVVGATFISYFLIPVGQKHLRPVVVSMYTYVQPVVAMVIALSLGLDQLTVLKVLATVLVFTGVGLVNFTPSRTPSTPSVPSAPSTPIK